MKITIVNGIIIKNGKILLLKKFSKDYYETPGGKIEENESIEGCLVRELQEEIGVTVISFIKFLEMEKFNFENKEITNYAFLIRKFKGKPRIIEEHIFEKMIWVSIKEANKLSLSPNVTEIVKKLKGEGKDI